MHAQCYRNSPSCQGSSFQQCWLLMGSSFLFVFQWHPEEALIKILVMLCWVLLWLPVLIAHSSRQLLLRGLGDVCRMIWGLYLQSITWSSLAPQQSSSYPFILLGHLQWGSAVVSWRVTTSLAACCAALDPEGRGFPAFPHPWRAPVRITQSCIYAVAAPSIISHCHTDMLDFFPISLVLYELLKHT